MRTRSRILSIGLAAAAAPLLACAVACTSAKTPAASVDPTLAGALKTTLARDGRLASAPNVDVDPSTGVVRLSGRVGSAEERESAGRLVCSVKGVTVVYNEIEIQRAAR